MVKIAEDVPDWSLFAWSNPTNIVYGPVSSRRLGSSLGINLFPEGKICSFQCAYCDLDLADRNQQRPRLVPTEQIASRIAAEFPLLPLDPKPDSITFAGNGEPTLHPGFSQIVDLVAQLRDKWLPGTPMNIFTDGVHLADPAVQRAVTHFRRVFLKVDGASEGVVEQINGPGAWRGTTRAVALGRQFVNVAASTVLAAGRCANTDDVRSDQFVNLVEELRPCELYLYTLDYPNPSPSLGAVDFHILIDAADWLAARVGCPVIALWRRHPYSEIPLGAELF